MSTAYDFNEKDRKGNVVSLTECQGKVLMIVNTITRFRFIIMTRAYNQISIRILEIPSKFSY